jgi:Vitamin K epoxide reductase family/SPW repeat
VSKAFPVSDAAFGGLTYMLETLMGAMGSAKRWRTMPWMVTFFFILVVPLGGVSIGFIIIQPIMIGTYCTLCLIQAFAMLVMIPLAIDEVVAMSQYMVRSRSAGRPFWRTFFQGGPDDAAQRDDNPGFGSPISTQAAAAVWGVTMPWTLVASCAIGVWLMFSRLVFDTSGLLADSDHLVGAMIITVAVTAMAEVVRPLRFVNTLFGVWLMAAPWLLADGLSAQGAWNDIVAGVVVIALSLPRGRRSAQHYGGWDRYVV